MKGLIKCWRHSPPPERDVARVGLQLLDEKAEDTRGAVSALYPYRVILKMSVQELPS